MSVQLALLHDPLEVFRKEGLSRPLPEGVVIVSAPCRDAGDFLRWINNLSERLDGLLFTDELLLRSLEEQALLPSLPCVLVRPSTADILRTLMRRAGGVYHGSLSRVLIDVGSGAEALNEILQTQLRPLIVTRDIWGAAPGETFAQALLRRYRVAWNGGSFDLIIMNQSGLLETMHNEGINVWCLLPGVETVRQAAQSLALSIVLSREQDRNPVCVLVGVRSGKIAVDTLKGPLEAYNRAHGQPFVLARRGGVLELSACGLSREELTTGRLPLAIAAQLTQSDGQTAVIGWGIGVSTPHARDCAERAYREALFDVEGGSYLIDERSDLYGPFRTGTAPVSRMESFVYLRRAAQQAGISASSMARIQQAANRLGTENVTSAQLAHSLGMTQRSASRLLANLAAHGAAKLCEEKADAGRGRPAKRYKLLL